MTPILFSQGLELLVYGMGSVILFLTLLVFATRLMSWVVLTYFPEPPVLVKTPMKTPVGAPAQGLSDSTPVDPRLLAAMAAAVDCHRRRSVVRDVPADA
ncbi:MAG: OadG family protein [Congregibacter sp.]